MAVHDDIVTHLGRLLSEHGPMTARQLVERLRLEGRRVPKSAVNPVLYGDTRFFSDGTWPPTWSLSPRLNPATAAKRALLKRLQMTNWKAHAGTINVDLAPLTVLLGTNSSGKSSILQSILVLTQSWAHGQLLLNGDLANCGEFANAVHGHTTTDYMALGLMAADGNGDRHSLSRGMYQGQDGSMNSIVSLSRGERNLVLLRQDSKKKKRWTSLNGDGDKPYVFKEGRTCLPGDIAEPGRGIPWLDHSSDTETEWLLQRAQWYTLFEGLLNRVIHLGPMRPIPDREIPWPGDDGALRPGAQLITQLHANDELRFDVNDWLGRLEIPYTVDVVVSEGSASMTLTRSAENGEYVQLQDVGFGISQVLPIVVTALAARNKTILVEQPEVHLHPRLQAVMADMFAQSMLDYGNQFVIETHSEHFLLRLQRRVAESMLERESVGIYFVERVAVGTAVTKVLVEPDGSLSDDWPAGFFDDRLDDLIAIAEAQE